MSTHLQTIPKQQCDGTVLISMKDGKVQEVISDLQLDVQVFDADGGAAILVFRLVRFGNT